MLFNSSCPNLAPLRTSSSCLGQTLSSHTPSLRAKLHFVVGTTEAITKTPVVEVKPTGLKCKSEKNVSVFTIHQSKVFIVLSPSDTAEIKREMVASLLGNGGWYQPPLSQQWWTSTCFGLFIYLFFIFFIYVSHLRHNGLTESSLLDFRRDNIQNELISLSSARET